MQNITVMNKNPIRGTDVATRRPTALKSSTYTESGGVYGARMNVEGSVHYPGRSPALPERATAAARQREDAGEVSRGHSSSRAFKGRDEGPKMK